MDELYGCQICGKRVAMNFYFCNPCAIENGIADNDGRFLKPLEWPPWAREIYNTAQKARRRERTKKELGITETPYIEEPEE